MGILIQEEYVNKTQSLRCGSSDVYESRYETMGDLYRGLVKEFGRCVSKMYVDKKDGGAKCIGWVFEKRMKYDDSNETFMQETWISVHEQKPEVVKTVHYAQVA